MEKLLSKVIKAESKHAGITQREFYELCDIGCKIAFTDDLKTRLSKFKNLSEKSLREFLLELANGGAVYVASRGTE